MTITAQQYADWLVSKDAIRNVIVTAGVNISGSETTVKMSLKKFESHLPIIKSGLVYSENLSVDGTPSLSIGDLDIENTNGQFDYALDYVWTNRSIQVYIGDVSWPEADYQLVLDGIINKLTSKDRTTLNLVLQDKMQRLNAPVTEVTLGGTTANKDAVLPILLGECCNITPLLVDPNTRTYQYNGTSSEGLIEVRDDCQPMTVTENAAAGTFVITYAPLGTVTCSAQGHKVGGTTYSNKVGALCAAIATEGGKANTRFLTSEVDYANINAFDASYPYPVGYYVGEKENMLEVMQALASSFEAQVVTTRLGKLRLLTLTPGTSVRTVTENDWEWQTLAIEDRTDPIASIKLGFCKNWTVQSDIKRAIPVEHKDLFAEEWRTKTVTDATVQALHKLTTVPEQIDTYLLTEAAATTEANRRLNFWKVPKTIFTFVGLPSCLTLELGQTITLKANKFGLNAGKLGVIISMSFDWIKFRVTIGVLV